MILLLVYVIDTPVKVVIIVKVEIESSQLVPILAFCTQQMANKQIITDPPLSFRKLGKYTQHFGQPVRWTWRTNSECIWIQSCTNSPIHAFETVNLS